MKSLKTYIKYIEYTTISILISSLLISTLYYFNILGDNITTYLRPLVIIINIFISCYKLGKKADKNGYLEGLKFSGIITLLLFLISLIFYRNLFSIKVLIYYFIIVSIGVLASMIGISKKTGK